jgi:hypothetical protein
MNSKKSFRRPTQEQIEEQEMKQEEIKKAQDQALQLQIEAQAKMTIRQGREASLNYSIAIENELIKKGIFKDTEHDLRVSIIDRAEYFRNYVLNGVEGSEVLTNENNGIDYGGGAA